MKTGFDDAVLDWMQEHRIDERQSPAVDFTIQDEGSIFLLHPHTDAAQEWIGQHIPEDAQYFGTAIVIEHRYIADIVEGIRLDGLVVKA